MTFQKFNVLAELRKLAKRSPARPPVWLNAELSIERFEEEIRNWDVEELERLFHLPDTRNG